MCVVLGGKASPEALKTLGVELQKKKFPKQKLDWGN